MQHFFSSVVGDGGAAAQHIRTLQDPDGALSSFEFIVIKMMMMVGDVFVYIMPPMPPMPPIPPMPPMPPMPAPASAFSGISQMTA